MPTWAGQHLAWFAAIDSQRGMAAAAACIAAGGKVVMMFTAFPDNGHAGTTEFQRLAHAGTVVIVDLLANGVTQHCAQHTANDHANDTIILAGNLTADDRAGHAADDRADFITVAFT